MKIVKGIAHRMCLIAICCSTASGAGAASWEEMQRLNAAYPPGSVVVCRGHLPGDGKTIYPTTLKTRAKVESWDNDRIVYHASITWSPENAQKSNAGDLTLTYRMTSRSTKEGEYSLIDPDSMVVAMPAVGPTGEETILNGFRNRMGSTEKFTSYSQTEITEFPSFIFNVPGEAPLYCHKENS